MKLAVYPGSFDPVTLGHEDIIARASVIFDRVIVAVMVNRRKSTLFSLSERKDFLQRVTARFPNVEVDSSDKLLVDYAKQRGAHVIVKGLRALSDFELEFQMALINRKLCPSLDTVFLTTTDHFQYLSSSVVKEIGILGGDIASFIDPLILPDIRARLHTAGTDRQILTDRE